MELTLTIGTEVIVTITVAVSEQVAELLPTTVYVVVTVGFAVTVEPVVALNPVDGDHEYVAAPVAVRVPLKPMQIVIGLTVTNGKGETVTRATAVVVPHVLVPVTV